MSLLSEKIIASKKIFFIYLSSLFALWMGKHISDQYLTSISKQIVTFDLVKYFDSLYFVFTICLFLFGIQFLIIIFSLVYKLRRPINKTDRSILLEIFFISMTILNSSLVLLLILIRAHLFIPSKATTFLVLFAVLFLSLAVTYSLLMSQNETDEADSKFTIWTKLEQFGFPHFREVFAISWALATLITVLQFNVVGIHSSFFTWLIFRLFPFSIVVSGIVYFALGLSLRIKRMDELERHIYYERSSIIFIILIVVVLSFNFLDAFFEIRFEFVDFGIIIGPAILISELFVRARYS